MLRTLLLVTAVLWTAAPAASQAMRKEILPAGTLLQCTLSEPNFSSKTAVVGDPVLCHLSSLAVFGHPVFPRGAELSGRLQDYKNPGHFVGKGWMNLAFDRLVLPGGQVLPLSAKVIFAPHLNVDAEGKIHGKGHPKRDAVEWMIPVLWPIKVLTLPARGPYPALRGETRISLRLMEDVEVGLPPTARVIVPAPPWAETGKYQNSSDAVLRPASDYQVRQFAEPLRSHTSTSSEDAGEESVLRPTVIVLRGGTAYVARQYWVQSGRMHFVSEDGEERLLPLERIDLSQTVRLNRERNVEFILQSKDTVEQ